MAHQQTERDPWDGPRKDGLYDPQLEREACGVGFIVAIDGKRSNKVTDVYILYCRETERERVLCRNV